VVLSKNRFMGSKNSSSAHILPLIPQTLVSTEDARTLVDYDSLQFPGCSFDSGCSFDGIQMQLDVLKRVPVRPSKDLRNQFAQNQAYGGADKMC